MTSTTLALLGNHLWQSTLFAALIALLTLALRPNRARTRYWLWLAASVKFLVPFSLLVALGSHLPWPQHAPSSRTVVYTAIEKAAEPFTQLAQPRTRVAPLPPHVTATHTTAAHAVISQRVMPPAETAHGNISHPTSSLAVAKPSALTPSVPASQGRALNPLPIFAALWLAGFAVVCALWMLRWRRISEAMRASVHLQVGREAELLRSVERRLKLRRPIELLVSPALLEPGTFGIARPALLWPEGISEQLDDAQLAAVLAHEACHIRWRDNLTALLHMLVEALFWFHPLVWWLETRLVEERERACDEEVLLLGNQPDVYAESILKVCAFCIASPLVCVTGVTGANLKKRMGNIMSHSNARKLGIGRKALLLAAGSAVIALPVLFGQASASPRSSSAAAVTRPLAILLQPLQTPATKSAPGPSPVLAEQLRLAAQALKEQLLREQALPPQPTNQPMQQQMTMRGLKERNDQETMLLFFDLNSMPAQDLRGAVAAARRFIDLGMKQEDRIAVVSFGHGLKIEQDFTSDRDLLDRALEYTAASTVGIVEAAGGAKPPLPQTASALEAAARMLAPMPQQRKTLVYLFRGPEDHEGLKPVTRALNKYTTVLLLDTRRLRAEGEAIPNSLQAAQTQNRTMLMTSQFSGVEFIVSFPNGLNYPFDTTQDSQATSPAARYLLAHQNLLPQARSQPTAPQPDPATQHALDSVASGMILDGWQTLQRLNPQIPLSQQSAEVQALNGKTLNIPGFMVPLVDRPGNTVNEFLLVPYAGADIHVPAPPQNQMIYVRTSANVPVNPTKPIIVSGRLHIDTVVSPYGNVSFDMVGASVLPYGQEQELMLLQRMVPRAYPPEGRPAAVSISTAATADVNGVVMGVAPWPNGGLTLLPVAGAKLSLTNVKTDAVIHAVTEKDGAYHLHALPPGDYIFNWQADGFIDAHAGAYPLRGGYDTGWNFTLARTPPTHSSTPTPGLDRTACPANRNCPVSD